MNRRTFNKLAGLAAIGTMTENVELSAERAAAVAGEIVLQDDEFLVAFDGTSGAFVRMERNSTGWKVERRPALGVSFRLHAPLSNRRDNFVLGQKQRPVSVEKVSDHQLRLQWKDLLSEHGGVLPMTFTATVTLIDGVLTFESVLDNDSSLWVETIDYPYFGDLNPPVRDARMTVRTARYDNLELAELYPRGLPDNLYQSES